MRKDIFITAILLCGFFSVDASLRHRAEMPAITVSTVDTIDGEAFVRLDSPGLYADGEIGSPALPVVYLKFSVPYDAYGFSVAATPSDIEEILLPAAVMPIQEPVKASLPPAAVGFTKPSASVYGTDGFYPSALVKVADEGFYMGDNHIVTVAVTAASYNPVYNTLRTCKSVEVELSYSTGESRQAVKAISRLTAVDRSGELAFVNSIVVNPGQVERFRAPAKNLAKVQTATNLLPAYEYCVVTSRKLAPSFSRLISWKRQKGYDAGVVCIEDILSHPSFRSGDLVSGINDDAGKLRAYLRYAYEDRGIGKFVLLAGDYTVLPIRYGNVNTDSFSLDSTIPSDLYFSDLNGNWNVDGDEFYGEVYNDDLDFYPELYVGRLLCTENEEVENYTEKLLRYELNPGNGDYSYLKKGFISQSDGMLCAHEANTVASRFGMLIPKFTIFSELPSYNDPNPTFPTGTDVVNEMNNRYGFFSWHGHGSPGGILTKADKDKGEDGWWNFHAILARTDTPLNMKAESDNGLDKLTNYDFPAIAYTSSACDVTPFDIYGDYNVKYNMGSSFTVGGLYGGPAFLGNTRSGWYSYGGDGPSLRLELNFIEQLKQGTTCLGIAEANSKIKSNPGDYVRLTHSLIGDPEFEMWTDVPSTYDGLSISRTDNSISLTGSGVDGSNVAVRGFGELPKVEVGDGNVVDFRAMNPNGVVTIYKHNSIPKVMPVALQNDSIFGIDGEHLFVDDIAIGASVDTNRKSGDFVFGSDCDITIEATGKVELYPGFKITEGASVTLKSSVEVEIYGGELSTGSILNIIAPSVSMVGLFEAERGSSLNIIKN